MGAIYIDPTIKRATMNRDECVECYGCYLNYARSGAVGRG